MQPRHCRVPLWHGDTFLWLLQCASLMLSYNLIVDVSPSTPPKKAVLSNRIFVSCPASYHAPPPMTTLCPGSYRDPPLILVSILVSFSASVIRFPHFSLVGRPLSRSSLLLLAFFFVIGAQQCSRCCRLDLFPTSHVPIVCTPRAIVLQVVLATARMAYLPWTLRLLVETAAVLAHQGSTWLCHGLVPIRFPMPILVMSMGTIFTITAVKLLKHHVIPKL